MNNTTGKDTIAGPSSFQEDKEPPPSQSALSKCDKQIMKAMGLFANVLRSARREADDANVSATRKAELEAWIERHAAEIDVHIEVSRISHPKTAVQEGTNQQDRNLEHLLALVLIQRKMWSSATSSKQAVSTACPVCPPALY